MILAYSINIVSVVLLALPRGIVWEKEFYKKYQYS